MKTRFSIRRLVTTTSHAWLVLSLTAALLLIAPLAHPQPAEAQKFAELAKVPPLGWNSWNRYGCNIDEKTVMRQADAMVSSGLKAAGYRYIVIDDCWHGERDKDGLIQPHPQHFSNGMKKLADYVHAKGLSLGIYSDAGGKTCGGMPGSRGREYQDALTYARWGIDYLKYDWCHADDLNAPAAYRTMSEALRAAGRPVVFSVCEWGQNEPWKWAGPLAHLWRTTGDITACFDCIVDHGTWKSWGVLQILDKQEGLRRYAGPGRYNDPDMLEVGNGMTAAEDRAHFSMWAMLSAPLIAGNDLASMSKETLSVLANGEVIRVDQDPLVIQAFRYLSLGDLEVWFKPLDKGELAVAFLNRGKAVQSISFDWAEHGTNDDQSHRRLDFKTQTYRVRDLWAQRDLGTTQTPLAGSVAAHDVWMLRLRP
ncbi:MAG TPA: glycoside hydrolase family 27 protein [Polyangiaceae bacterium]|nr:glycoside hydrolase family 27 protein [Polyangiaceae bacterium]